MTGWGCRGRAPCRRRPWSRRRRRLRRGRGGGGTSRARSRRSGTGDRRRACRGGREVPRHGRKVISGGHVGEIIS
uniref:Uncharacterized protein n=1 Tax=Arundo donax TaxID=35708 RepID=A0A0A9EJZ6_ARUDO